MYTGYPYSFNQWYLLDTPILTISPLPRGRNPRVSEPAAALQAPRGFAPALSAYHPATVVRSPSFDDGYGDPAAMA